MIGARRGPSTRAATTRIEDDALLVRRVPFGDADLVATLFTPTRGIVAAVARGARRASSKLSSLEPFHRLRVAFDERPDAELSALREANIVQARTRLAASLDCIDAAGRCLRWVRRGLPPRTPEPSVWLELDAVLDALDAPAADTAKAPLACAATFGLRLLVDIGWGLELARCASCGKPCAPTSSAYVDAARGGVVCRACGGGTIGGVARLAASHVDSRPGAARPLRPVLLKAAARGRLIDATAGDDAALVDAAEAGVAADLVDAALAAHAA